MSYTGSCEQRFHMKNSKNRIKFRQQNVAEQYKQENKTILSILKKRPRK